MTWPDVVRSVTARISDCGAQDRELRAIYSEMAAKFPPSQLYLTVHCYACGYDSIVRGESDQSDPQFCLHCGAPDPEIIDASVGSPPRP